jgi:hypothetical protein
MIYGQIVNNLIKINKLLFYFTLLRISFIMVAQELVDVNDLPS